MTDYELASEALSGLTRMIKKLLDLGHSAELLLDPSRVVRTITENLIAHKEANEPRSAREPQDEPCADPIPGS